MKSPWSYLCPLLLCWVLLQTGCASNADLNGVNVTITELRPAGGAQATMTLNFVNENVIPIAVSGGTYTLLLNGSPVGKAMSHDAVGLPSQSTASINVTVTLDNAALLKKTDGATASYRLDSILRIDAGEEHLTLKTSSSGSVDISAFR